MTSASMNSLLPVHCLRDCGADAWVCQPSSILHLCASSCKHLPHTPPSCRSKSEVEVVSDGRTTTATGCSKAYLIRCLPWPERVWISIIESDGATASVSLMPVHQNQHLIKDEAGDVSRQKPTLGRVSAFHLPNGTESERWRWRTHSMQGCSLCRLPTTFVSCKHSCHHTSQLTGAWR